jgi:hypothetical protein
LFNGKAQSEDFPGTNKILVDCILGRGVDAEASGVGRCRSLLDESSSIDIERSFSSFLLGVVSFVENGVAKGL